MDIVRESTIYDGEGICIIFRESLSLKLACFTSWTCRSLFLKQGKAPFICFHDLWKSYKRVEKINHKNKLPQMFCRLF